MTDPSLLVKAQNIKQDMIQLRRRFHMYPELGLEEHRTVETVEATLHALGIATHRVAGTGLIGLLTGKYAGKTVALRADMDALPISDAKKVAYASSIPGKMHACGHDVHTAGLLGAAMLLCQYKNQMSGNVKFFFQPAEETTGGALPMIQEGAMENPKVDAVFGLHVSPELEVGKIGLIYGKSHAASDMFDVVIQGRSSHGAAPHNGVDAIFIGSQIVGSLQGFVSRMVDPLDSAVVTVGKFSGGYQRNIIADTVEMSGIIRTLDPQTREMAKREVKKIIEGVAASLGAIGKISFIPSYPCLINTNSMVDLVRNATEELLGKENVVMLEKPSMGVEDFAYFVQEAPGAFYRLGVGNAAKGIVQPLHTNLFDVDEEALVVAAAVHARVALAFLRA